MPEKKPDTTVRMDSDLRYRAKEQALKERRTLRELVEDAVRQYLKKKAR